MDSDSFKKFFSSTMGIVAAVLILTLGLCVCCLVLAAAGQQIEKSKTPTGLIAPAAIEASF